MTQHTQPCNHKTTSRTFAIGDIHGCNSQLQHLLNWIAPTKNDTVIFLGDMIDRGDDSKGVLDTIMALQQQCPVVTVMGNHEQMLLQSRKHLDALKAWLRYGGKEALLSFGLTPDLHGILALPNNYVDFLKNCQNYHETNSHIFCHATPVPHIDIAAQTEEGWRWRTLTYGQPAHISNKTIVCGHTEQREGKVHYQSGLVCIDTFAYGGGWLTAFEVGNHTAWQVNAQGKQRQQVLPVAFISV